MPAVELVINGTDNSGGAIQSASSGIGGIGQIAAGILASGVFQKIAGAVVDFGKDVVEKSIEAQNIQAAFAAQLKATGHEADGTAELVDKYAQQILKTTKYDDDAAKAASTVLLGFQRIGQDVLPGAIQSSADLAAKLGIDLPAAAAMVGKALGGDLAEGGIGKLNTAFKLFDKEQLKAVEDMAAAGDQAGAQKMILDALNKTVGGQAVAAGKTFEGSWTRIQNQMDNVKESLGGPLLDALAGVFDKLSQTGVFDALGKVAEEVGKNMADIVPFAMSLVDAFTVMGDPVDGVANALYRLDDVSPIFDDLGETVGNFHQLLDVLSAWWQRNSPAIIAQGQRIGIALNQALEQISQKLTPFIDQQLKKFEAWFTENGPLIMAVINQIANQFVMAIPFVVSFFDVIMPFLDGAITLVLDLAKIYMQVFTGDLPGAWETAQKAAVSLAKNIEKTFKAFVNWVMSFFGTNLKAVTKQWDDNFKQLQQIVSSIMIIIQGKISEGVEGVKTSFMTGIQSLIDGANGMLGSFAAFGSSILNNIQMGISNNLEALKSFMHDTIISIINAALAAVGLPPLVDNGGGNESFSPLRRMGVMRTAAVSVAMAGGGNSSVSNSRSTFYNFGTVNNLSLIHI